MNAIVSTKAKLFWNGRSQAVRLPKAFRFEGTEVLLHWDGNTVVMAPAISEAVDPSAWIYALEALDEDAVAAVLDRKATNDLLDDEVAFD